MKEKLKVILMSIVLIISAVVIYFCMGDYVFYIWLIPFNNVVLGIILGVVGVVGLIAGITDKKE